MIYVDRDTVEKVALKIKNDNNIIIDRDYKHGIESSLYYGPFPKFNNNYKTGIHIEGLNVKGADLMWN